MEDLQAERLLRLVNHTRGTYLIPTGVELVDLFFSEGEKRMTPRGAREVVKRLAKHGCIRGENRKRYIDIRRVVTQMPSCLYLLCFYKLCVAHKRSLPKDVFDRQVEKQYHAKFTKLGVSFDNIFRYAVRADYIRPVKTEPGMLEIGDTLTFFLPYLQLFRKGSKP